MPYIKTESDKVIAWVDDDYKDFDSLEEYFKQHPELEVPKNEESGLPFWEDDFMMTHSED